MKIFINTFIGETLTFEVEPDDTIDSIKAKIQDQEGILSTRQYLNFGSERLENKRTLNDFNIRKESILYLIY